MGWSQPVRGDGGIPGTDPEIIFQVVEMIKISELPCYFRGVCADPYQNGYAIFGMGKTDEEAIADAMQWVDEPDELQAQIESGQRNVHGDMKLITISRALRDAVIEHGGDLAIIEDWGIQL